MNANRQSREELRALVQGYIDSVLDGSRVVGKLERLCVERHVRDLEAVESGERENLRFDEERGMHFLRFCVRYVRHTKGEWSGKPFRFEERSAWMAFIGMAIFGWLRIDDKGNWYRRFRTVYISVARKNGKTMFAAMIALYMLAFDGEPGAECYFAATKRDQARLGWKQAQNIVRKSNDKHFRRLFHITESTSTISLTDDDAFCVALGKDKDSHDGPNPHFAGVDELHAHKDREQWDVLESGMGARREPMMLGTTTAGARRMGLCWDLDHDCQRVLEGLIFDDSTFGYIARIDDEDDWEDESVWCKANPNLGVSVKIQKLRDNAQKAKNNPAYQNEFRRKHTNCWTEASTAWLPVPRWDACASDSIDLRHLYGEPCFVGVDVSAVADFFSAAAVFPRPDHLYEIHARHWIPKDTIHDRVHNDRVPVDVWVDQGLVHATDGEIVDHTAVKLWLQDLRKNHDIVEVPCDPNNSWQLMSDLEQDGFTVVRFTQGPSMVSPAMKEAEKLILCEQIAHAGDPVMRWMFANVSVRVNSYGDVRPDKERCADRIDGVMAAIMGLGRAILHQDRPRASVGVWG